MSATATPSLPARPGSASAEAGRTSAPLVVFFSSVSGNTARFVEKLGMRSARIPLFRGDGPLEVNEPFVLVLPTYGGGNGEGAVPKQVIRFLNDENNRRWIRGVISTGNTNFGEAYCIAGDIISRKCRVPHLDRVELFGTPDDVLRVSEGLEKWWKQQ
ncbi:class Ib ribonucleoside-diphosphate reductase assembly flavoprotein NrdI [Microbacterium sp. ZXX196]|uniref:class Ib ribonucleoside-diphosphate reductase assembly flavoprotein NrdI n=1 Tax=Microbacterium sp. ZXX196 TaxID=2609291 RepID=UPI0012B77606|nr:class Ib ribonucleoside-diphosphate reductase assembly flavoprotein NrdI [Microbacterium sp. ZXX196]MTE22972.1 class Ib ribonucleoside-diphosphate reductase assembly flavoprotein NrdI [Microbacterium sp. ZXX196]